MSSALSVAIICLVVGISDGDTITAKCDNNQVKVRLAEIDAPEKRQAFYQASKQSLSDLCYDKEAVITGRTTDRYRRLIAHVSCDGKDASSEQVKHGMAWVYDQYVTDHNLYNIQESARLTYSGLWQDSNPIPPWEWRKKKRKKE